MLFLGIWGTSYYSRTDSGNWLDVLNENELNFSYEPLPVIQITGNKINEGKLICCSFYLRLIFIT